MQRRSEICRRLRDEDYGVAEAAWLLRVRKGDRFRVGGSLYEVTQYNPDKRIRLVCEGVATTITRYGSTLCLPDAGRSGRKTKANTNFFRDVEGDLMVDMVNEFNPFHEPSDIFRIYHQNLDLLDE